jgi:hypothetical protein
MKREIEIEGQKVMEREMEAEMRRRTEEVQRK